MNQTCFKSLTGGAELRSRFDEQCQAHHFRAWRDANIFAPESFPLLYSRRSICSNGIAPVCDLSLIAFVATEGYWTRTHEMISPNSGSQVVLQRFHR